MLMTRRKIIAQTMIGNETRPIKAKLRNASCLWDTHQRYLWVLDFMPLPDALRNSDHQAASEMPPRVGDHRSRFVIRRMLIAICA